MWFVDRRVDRRSAYECNVIIACRSFIRNKELALYTIYKNIVYVLANFFFSFFSAYSAQSIFPELLLSTYNLLWTLFPVIAVAILERDVCHYTAENNPEIIWQLKSVERINLLWMCANGPCQPVGMPSSPSSCLTSSCTNQSKNYSCL
jgi:hypothetical protein